MSPGPAPETLAAPVGFAELWPQVVGQWYAATLPALSGDATVTPTTVISDGSRWQRLGLLVAQPFDTSRPNTLATIANVNAPRTVSVPCAGTTTLRLLGTGTATLSIGAATWNATSASSASVVPSCLPGVDHVEGTVTGSSGRKIASFVTLAGANP